MKVHDPGCDASQGGTTDCHGRSRILARGGRLDRADFEALGASSWSSSPGISPSPGKTGDHQAGLEAPSQARRIRLGRRPPPRCVTEGPVPARPREVGAGRVKRIVRVVGQAWTPGPGRRHTAAGWAAARPRARPRPGGVTFGLVRGRSPKVAARNWTAWTCPRRGPGSRTLDARTSRRRSRRGWTRRIGPFRPRRGRARKGVLRAAEPGPGPDGISRARTPAGWG